MLPGQEDLIDRGVVRKKEREKWKTKERKEKEEEKEEVKEEGIGGSGPHWVSAPRCAATSERHSSSVQISGCCLPTPLPHTHHTQNGNQPARATWTTRSAPPRQLDTTHLHKGTKNAKTLDTITRLPCFT